MRAFLGVEISDSVRNRTWSFIRKARKEQMRGIKFVEKQNLHITLKFLGEVSESRKSKIITALRNFKGEPFSLKISGVGAFPNMEKPRVFWFGVEDTDGGIQKLHSFIDSSLEPLGFQKEPSFIPHLTFGRVKSPLSVSFMRFIRDNTDEEFGEFTVERFVLFKSTLTRYGPIYDVVEVFPFL